MQNNNYYPRNSEAIERKLKSEGSGFWSDKVFWSDKTT